MAKFSQLRKVAIAAAAAVGMILGAGNAAAQPVLPEIPGIPHLVGLNPDGSNKQLVTFGDSFTANAGKGGGRALVPAQHPLVSNCVTDRENWPTIAAQDLGMSLGDWSCNGTGWPGQLQAYLEGAIAYGDVGPGTEKIVVMYGGMDVLQWVDVAGDVILQAKPQPLTPYHHVMKAFTDRARQAAPNAEIVITSYPELATNDQICLVNTPGQTNPIPVPGATRVQEGLRDSLRASAHATGSRFIDVYQETIGHGTCHPDPNQRYVVGMSE